MVSFVVAYVAVAWLLRFVAHHPITWFVGYRVASVVILIVLLGDRHHRPRPERLSVRTPRPRRPDLNQPVQLKTRRR